MNPVPPFRSDNTAGACAAVMEAMARANDGQESAYGADEFSVALNKSMSDLFERQCWCSPVGTGTAANALALAAVSSAGTRIACHAGAHILRSEDEAVRFFSPGVQLEPLPGEGGRIAPNTLERKRAAAQFARWSALSLAQLTEAGTLYDTDAVAALCDIARHSGARVHMDGARFANAVATLGCTPAQASWRSGIDLLSFGATKNGGMNADAIVAFDRKTADAVRSRLKRSGQLTSKMRFMAVQLLALVDDGLWLRNARHANAMARRLRDRLAMCADVEILHAVDGNHLFLRLAEPLARHLGAAGALPWRSGSDEQGRPIYRLVTSFATAAEEVDRFAALAMRKAQPAMTGTNGSAG